MGSWFYSISREKLVLQLEYTAKVLRIYRNLNAANKI